jgi:Phosphotransferase enzyme family
MTFGTAYVRVAPFFHAANLVSEPATRLRQDGSTMTIYPVPEGSSAIRLDWRFLPPRLRGFIERKCGSPVVQAYSCDAGFTPGFASVLVCEDGSRHFVKAASAVAQRSSAASYREEGRVLAALPGSVPAPRLLWMLDDDWVALGIQHVEARPPARPWRREDLDATLDALEASAVELTPPPAGLAPAPAADELASWAGHWSHVRATRPDLPHLEEAAALAGRFEEAVQGESVVHTDVRADNVLIDSEGRAWLCDWNWPVTGAAWLDSFMALVGPKGDGLDVEPLLTGRPLLAAVPAEHLDIVLALLAGYFFAQGDQPVPAASPHLREHQSWQAHVCWQWLCERRGWAGAGDTSGPPT